MAGSSSTGAPARHSVAALGCAHSRGGQTGSRGKHGGQVGRGGRSRRRPAPGIQGRFWVPGSGQVTAPRVPQIPQLQNEGDQAAGPRAAFENPERSYGAPSPAEGIQKHPSTRQGPWPSWVGGRGLSSPRCPRTWPPPSVFLPPHHPCRRPWPQEHTWGALGDALAPGRHLPAGAAGSHAGSGRFILGPAPPATLAPKTPRCPTALIP